jgi:hypothetical protein
MTWRLSRFRTGDLVEVRCKEEIVATLDEQGCVDDMPFMPEMLQFCGRRFRVGAVAHKTCDTVSGNSRGRRLSATVHLAGLRCDGSAHGGCQADCNLFWKDVWLKPVPAAGNRAEPPSQAPGGCSEEHLLRHTQCAGSAADTEPRYSCQATRLLEATEPLASWDLRQYLLDVLTRNQSPGRVLRVLWLAAMRWLQPRMPVGYRLFKAFHDRMHLWLSGRPSPSLHGKVPPGTSTPTGQLDLQPGEYVRIKPKAEIEQTLDALGNNRGLSFDPEEMAPYCGRVFKVRSRVSKIIDETTGKMRHMKQPCIILEDVVCNSEYASCRLNCPRAIYSYWRELWLERVPGPSTNGHHHQDARTDAAAAGPNGARCALPLVPADTVPAPSRTGLTRTPCA